MGQKVHPTGIRLGINKTSSSVWFADRGNYGDQLNGDINARKYLEATLKNAGISHIKIERPAKNAKITIYAARPGVIIGKKGSDVETLRRKVSNIIGVPVHINIEEVAKPELDAKLVAENIAQQLERRVMFRRAMKRTVQNTMRAGAKGIRINCAGRLGGAEIARTEWVREGRVPLHTLRADIDYATARANTTYGVIGVKVWIYKGDVYAKSIETPEVDVEDLDGSEKPAPKKAAAKKAPAKKPAAKKTVKKTATKSSDDQSADKKAPAKKPAAKKPAAKKPAAKSATAAKPAAKKAATPAEADSKKADAGKKED